MPPIRPARPCGANGPSAGRRALLSAIGLGSLAACGGVYLEIGGVPVVMSLNARVRSSTQVALEWSAYSGPISEYSVQRDGVEIARTLATDFLDAGAEPGEGHCYVVLAIGGSWQALGRSNRDCVDVPQVAPGWNLAELGDGAQAGVAVSVTGLAAVCIAGGATPRVRVTRNPLGAPGLVTIDAQATGGCAIAFDGPGAAHVAYGTASGMRYATDASGVWLVTGVHAGADSAPPAIALGGDGRAAIAYTRGSAVMLARRFGNDWSRETVLSAAGPRLAPHRLAFGADGQPRVLVASEEDGGTRLRLRLLAHQGGSWRTLLDRQGLGSAGALALEAGGAASVAHWERNPAALGASDAWRLVRVPIGADGRAGAAETIATDSAVGGAPALTVDAFGLRRLAWASATNRLEVATEDARGWSVQTLRTGDFDAVYAAVGLYGCMQVVFRELLDATIRYAAQ
ncbi:MAG: hypothetical protein JSW68_02995 [Burkholderiales bacterium]|nr:MAG: hypothetical protein JSW68_02995 [Burkholderiales bacterium]